MFRQARLVYGVNACALPGVSINYNNFMDEMRRAWLAGLIDEKKAEYGRAVMGLRSGRVAEEPTGSASSATILRSPTIAVSGGGGTGACGGE